MMTYSDCLVYADELRLKANDEEQRAQTLTGTDQLIALIRVRDWLKAAVAIATLVKEVDRLRKCVASTARALAAIGMPGAAAKMQDEIYEA